MAQKFLNGVHISGTTQLDFMPSHESEGIIKLGRYDSNTSRYHEIKSYVSSTEANNYLKFSLHNGTVNTVVDVLTLNGNKNATFAGTIGSGAITSTGKITGTELEGTSLDINGAADIGGNITMSSGGNIYNSTGTFTIQNNAGAQFDIKSNQGVRLYIDANGDDNVHKFEILSNTDVYDSANVVSSVDQSGNATFSGTVTANSTTITSDLSAAEAIDYPLIISSKDDDNNINQLGGEGVGIQFKIAGNAATSPGDSLVGASIAAIRESGTDADSSTALGFFITQNDETLDEAMHIDSSKKVGIGTSLPTTALQISTAMTSSPSSNIFLDVDGSNTNGGGGSIIFGTSASAGSATAYNAKITGTRATGGDGGDSELGFWTTLVSDSNIPQERMTISKEGYVGLNNTNPTSRLHVHHTEDDTDQDMPGSFAMEIDGNFTGTNSITTGNDREQGALYIDVDSSSTGGGTADEHRVYGIYSDTRFNGTADKAISVYGIAEQNTTTDNQSAYVIGVQGFGVTDGGADFLVSNIAGVWGEVSMQDATPVTNSYGGYFKNVVSTSRTGETTTTYGSYSEVEINSSSTFTNIKGKRIAIDVNTNDFTASSIHGLDIVFTGITNIPAATDTWAIYSAYDIQSYHKGKFGINRSEPEVALHVGPTALISTYNPTETVIAVSDTSNGAGIVIRGGSPYTWYDCSGGGTGQIFLDSASFDIYSGTPIDRTGGAGDTKGTSRLHVASDGKIGINKSDPTHQLNVYSPTSNVVSVFASGDNQAWISVQDDDSGTYGALFGTDSDAGHDVVLADSSAVKRLVVDDNGNVGIGALEVDSLLHIESTSDTASPIFTIENDNAKQIELGVVRSAGGTAPDTSFLAFDGDFRFITGSGTTTEVIRIDSDGNLGVNEDNPEAKIHVKQTVDREGIKISSSTVQPELTLIDDETGDYFGIGHNRSSSLLHFEHNNTSIMYLSHDGNLGIGTNDIDGKLHVVGTFGHWKINGYGGMYFNNSSDTNNIRYIHPRSNGNLSIGRGLTANLTSTDPNKYFSTTTDQLTIEADGGIIFNDYGSGSNTGTVTYNLAVDSSGNIIENSANTRSIFVATSTDTTTDVNATTTINWNSEDIKDSGYTHSDTTDPDEITITQAGTYKIYSAITYNTTVQRANVVLEILVNGTATTARGAGGYVRSDSGHNTGTTIVEDYVTISANDVIKIQTIQEAAGGVANLISNQSKLIIEKLTGLTLSTTNANTLGGLGATDFVAAAGDTMTGALAINEGGATIKKTNSSGFQTVLTVQELADEGSQQTLLLKNANNRDVGIKFETDGGVNYIWQDSGSGIDDALIFSTGGANRTTDAALILNQDQTVDIPNNTLNLWGQSTGTRHIKMDSGSASTANSYIGNYLGGTYLSTNYYYASGHNSDVGTQRSTEMFMDTNDIHFSTMPAGSPGSRTRILTIDGIEASVGVGTDSPQVKLHVNDTSSGEYLRVGTGGLRELRFSTYSTISDHAGHKIDASSSNGELAFAIGGDAKMYIKSSGKVGIDASDPKSKLDVDGGVKIGDDTDAASADKVGTIRYRTGTEYVEVNGKNLVYKGDFSKDEGWTKGTGWSIDNGVAKSDGTQSSDSYLNQTTFLVAPTYNKIYKCIFTVSNRTAGLVGPNIAGYHNSLVDSDGTHTVYVNVTNVNSNTVIYLQANASFVGHVDNFQVYEVEEKNASYADMCMQTGSGTYEWVNIVQNIY